VLEFLILIGRGLALACRGHQDVVLENLALRQQLLAAKRAAKRPRLQARDRFFWIVLAQLWRNWRTALVLVQSRYRCAMASRLASAPLDSTFETPLRGSSIGRSEDPHARPPNGDRESVVGRTADSWRVAHARHRRL
jgi:hypothetical protein